MSFVIDTIDTLSSNILETIKRFPLASLSAFISTIIIVILIEFEHIQYNQTVILAIKIAFVSTLGIFLFPALHLFNRTIWLKLMGLGIVALYYYFLPIVIGGAEVKRHLLLILALSFMYLWAPFINSSISNKNIWEWTQKILITLLATAILSLTLYLVASVTMYSIDRLFDIDIESRRYMQLFIIVVGIFSVNFFLSQIPKYILLLQVSTYSNIGFIFTKYVLTPITIIYLIILFSYIVKTMISQDWGSDTIDWMVIVFSFIAISSYMFWTPLWDRPNRKFRRLIWGSTLVLSVILALSIFIRLGVEDFYLLSLFTLWLFVISLYFLFFKNASYKWLFFSISLLIVASQYIPLLIDYDSITLATFSLLP